MILSLMIKILKYIYILYYLYKEKIRLKYKKSIKNKIIRDKI